MAVASFDPGLLVSAAICRPRLICSPPLINEGSIVVPRRRRLRFVEDQDIRKVDADSRARRKRRRMRNKRRITKKEKEQALRKRIKVRKGVEIPPSA